METACQPKFIGSNNAGNRCHGCVLQKDPLPLLLTSIRMGRIVNRVYMLYAVIVKGGGTIKLLSELRLHNTRAANTLVPIIHTRSTI